MMLPAPTEDICSPLGRATTEHGSEGRLAWSRTYRDLSPLPSVNLPRAADPHACRKTRQIAARCRKRAALLHEVVDSLNWMHGDKSTQAPRRRLEYPFVLAERSGMQGEVLARLEGLIVDQQPSAEAPSPQAALKKLLHGQAPYDNKGPPVGLAPSPARAPISAGLGGRVSADRGHPADGRSLCSGGVS